MSTKRPALIEQALERFKLASTAEDKQRLRELDDLKFADAIEPTDQWPEAIVQERSGRGPGAPVAPRPCLTINKLTQPVDVVSNQERNARLAITINPKSAGANQDTAEVFQGLIRNIEVESRAHVARSWAFERALKCGRGFYRILKTYANDGDDDLDLVIARILNQGSVYLDPFAQEPDWSDGEWAFIVADVPFARYTRMFPKSKVSHMDPKELSGLLSDAPDWVGGDKEARTVRIAEYFYVEFDMRTRVLVGTGQQSEWFWRDQLPEKPDENLILKSREVEQRQVKWCKINAIEVLEQEEWEGRYIPIIPVIGKEQFVDNARRFIGIVAPAKDAQRSYNYMRSAQVEAIGLAPKSPWVLDPEQIEGYEPFWQQSNTRNFPYLPAKVHIKGRDYPLPQRTIAEPAIQAITMAVQQADGDLKATTGVFDPSLGNLSASERSGKAILALQKQAELGSSNYLDNLANVSMNYEAKVLLDLIPHVYDRPGRIARILGEEDEPRSVMLNAPHVMQDGQPMPAQPGQQGAHVYNLTEGQYSVTVSVGKSFTTRREEGAASMGELLNAAPQMAPLIADLWVGEMDFPGARQIAERLKKTLPPHLLQSDDEQPDPVALQGQLQQATQMIELLSKELQAKSQLIETEAIKAQQEASIKQMELESKERIESQKIQAKLMEVQAQIQAEAANALLSAKIRDIEADLGMLRERQLQAEQQAHEAAMAGMEQEHQAGMAGAQMGHEQMMQAGQIEAQQQQQEAAL